MSGQLPALSQMIDRIAAPLAGLPSAPNRLIDDDMVAGQRAWLHTHFASVRDGWLSLGDLP
jgi:hypothetical protein